MLQLNKNKEGVGSMNIKKWSVSPLDKGSQNCGRNAISLVFGYDVGDTRLSYKR